ncbi:RICIN domain-containing protein [Blautia producta]|nr:RICIN domain-containing protein [Blautia producta]
MKKYILSMLLIAFSFFPCKVLYGSEITEPESEIQIEDGFYYILSGSNPTKCIDITAASKDSGANIQLNTLSDTASQVYAILQKSDGWYIIRNLNSQCNLDVAGANPNPGTNLQQCVSNGNDAQAFKFYQSSDQCVYIKNKLGTYIDLCNGDTTSGNNIQLFSFNGSSAQKWKLSKYQPSLHSEKLENGTYVIQNHKNKCMGIESSSRIAGKNITLSQYKQKKSQEFIITQENDGWYSLQNRNSKLYVDLAENATDTSILLQYPGHGQFTQKFQFFNNGNGKTIILTKYGTVLSTKNNVLQLNIFHASEEQYWTVKKIS